jgi:HD-GYP domain-containing protein (c-di-GMP phosphodiesterase class II)
MQLITLSGEKARVSVRYGERWLLHAYVAGLLCLASLSAIALALAGFSVGNIWATTSIAVLAAAAERGTVRLTQTTERSISLLPMLFAAVLFGPLAAGVVGAASMVGDPELTTMSRGRSIHLKWVTYTSTRFMVGAVMGLVATGSIEIIPSLFGGIVGAALFGAAVGEGLDVAFAALTAWVRGRQTSHITSTLVPLVLASAPLYAPVVAILTIAYQEISPWTAPLFFAPALAAQRLFSMYQEQRRLTVDLSSANSHLERANLSFAAALVATLDARDAYTAGHSTAVAIYSRDIAARMALSQEDQDKVHLCGLVHDIGKIGLAPGLLEKTGPLTLEERRQMQEHSACGERILANVDDYSDIARIVRHHHERVDGRGYPDALEGDDIPLLSRIIAVADAYNAMTSDRPYRAAMPSRVARLRLAQAVESQFDTSVVAAFEAILASSDEAYRLGTSAAFARGVPESDDTERRGLSDRSKYATRFGAA